MEFYWEIWRFLEVGVHREITLSTVELHIPVTPRARFERVTPLGRPKSVYEGDGQRCFSELRVEVAKWRLKSWSMTSIFTLGRHRRRRELSSFYAPACLSVPNDVTALTLEGFQLLAWNLVGWCTVPRSISLCKIAMLGQVLRVSRNVEIFHDRLGPGHSRWPILGNVRKSHYGLKFGGMVQCTMKLIVICNSHAQPMFTFSDLGRPRVLSFSERLVNQYQPRVSQDGCLLQIWESQPIPVMSYRANKPNFPEFWVKMAKMTLKVKVNDIHFQYQLRVSHDACLVQIWWLQL